MQKKKFWLVVMALIMVFSLLAACTPAAEEPAAEEPAAEEPAAEEPAMEEPTSMKAIIFTSTSLEEPWNSVYVASWDRVIAEKPHGLDISYDLAESVATADIARVMLEYYNTGEYDVFVFHDGG